MPETSDSANSSVEHQHGSANHVTIVIPSREDDWEPKPECCIYKLPASVSAKLEFFDLVSKLEQALVFESFDIELEVELFLEFDQRMYIEEVEDQIQDHSCSSGNSVVVSDAKRVLLGAGARALFYPTLLYNVVRNKIQSEFRWWDRVDELILLGAVPFPADVPRLRELGVSGVVTLNEPYETLNHMRLWSPHRCTISVSDSQNGLSPSYVVTLELENLSMEELRKAEMEELGKGKNFQRSYPPDSKPENKKALLNAFHIRRYGTNGSLFEKNSRKSFEDDLGDMSNCKRENSLSSDVGRTVSSNLDGNHRNLVKASSMRDTSKSKREGPLSSKFVGNPGNHVKASLRGRSVRTIRSHRYAAEAMKNEERGGNHLNYMLDQKASDEVETMYKRRHEMINRGSNNLSSTGAKKHDLDYHRPVDTPKATFPELHKRKNRELLKNLATEPKEEPEKETENLQVSSDTETVTDSVSDAGTNTNKVDKKAGEFIAKFREQIRLQKMASIGRSRGHDYFR
ncbi:hypothetical protein Q3G72_013663 [Acer saccharum]|nr:hypothetical protein Q3G72_013663 [Acer saccharum]